VNRTGSSLKRGLTGAIDAAVCVVGKSWRPLICISMGGVLLVNGIVLPLWTRTYPDLMGLAAVCGALAPFAWLRTKEKVEGVAAGFVASPIQPTSNMDAWT